MMPWFKDRRSRGRSVPALALLLLAGAPAARAADAPASEPIRHRMLLNDESRRALLYVDEARPESNWVIRLPWRSRDTRLIGNHRVLVTTDAGGFREYDLRTREVVREVIRPELAGAMTASRLPDGRTIVGCDRNGIAFHELDATGAVLRTAAFPQLNTLRLARLSPRGTLLFGGNTDRVFEADLKGKVLREVPLPGSRHNYQVLEKPDGHWLVSEGYGCAVEELDREGKSVRRWGGKPEPAGIVFIFFSQFQVLRNGHLVVATWTGHGENDSTKGQQLVEFAPDGKILWTWHDPKLAGSIHGVIILDDLDLDAPDGELAALGALK